MFAENERLRAENEVLLAQVADLQDTRAESVFRHVILRDFERLENMPTLFCPNLLRSRAAGIWALHTHVDYMARGALSFEEAGDLCRMLGLGELSPERFAERFAGEPLMPARLAAQFPRGVSRGKALAYLALPR